MAVVADLWGCDIPELAERNTRPRRFTPSLLSPCFFCCLTDLLFFSPFVESLRGIDPSRTDRAQSDQPLFQRLVVRKRLERPARSWCRHGLRRIILVFGYPGTAAYGTGTDNSECRHAKEERLIQACTLIPEISIYIPSHLLYHTSINISFKSPRWAVWNANPKMPVNQHPVSTFSR